MGDGEKGQFALLNAVFRISLCKRRHLSKELKQMIFK